MSEVVHGRLRVARHAGARGGTPAAPHPQRAVARLATRLTRRSTLVLTVLLAAWVAVEVASFRMAYPTGVSPLQFAMFADNPAVRMMQGVPVDIGTAGGFTVWDAGWMLMLLLGAWGALTSTRLLRGEEETGHAELLLAGPVRPARSMLVVLAVLALASLLLGAGVGVTLAVATSEWQGPALLGLALAGTAATFTAVGAVTSQVVDVRRRAMALALGALGLAWVVRMVASTADDRFWMRWLTPLGWLDELHPYGRPVVWALLPYAVAWAALAATAVVLRRRRDTGAALLPERSSPHPRLRGLSSPLAFAWRTNRGPLLAWAVLLGGYAALFGGLTATMVDWLEGDQAYRRLLEQLGFGAMLSPRGFMAIMSSFALLAITLQVVWRVGSARAEEEAGRLEAVLARPVSRTRWLAGHAVLALVGGLVLLAVTGTATWAGSSVAGSSDITWPDALGAALNGAPVVVVAAGLAVAMLGVAPRATVAVPAAVLPAAYLLTLLGASLRWPSWLLDLSPFTHLALVPVEPWAATSALVMTAVGVALLVLGGAAFHRRDVVAA